LRARWPIQGTFQRRSWRFHGMRPEMERSTRIALVVEPTVVKGAGQGAGNGPVLRKIATGPTLTS
jgi:hypothetical protein